MSGKHATVAFLSPNKEVAQQALGGNPLILHDEEFHGLKNARPKQNRNIVSALCRTNGLQAVHV